jgi:hypothetical protein
VTRGASSARVVVAFPMLKGPHVDGRAQLTRCDMAQNKPSWIFLSDKDGGRSAQMSPLQLRPPADRSVPGTHPLLSLL